MSIIFPKQSIKNVTNVENRIVLPLLLAKYVTNVENRIVLPLLSLKNVTNGINGVFGIVLPLLSLKNVKNLLHKWPKVGGEHTPPKNEKGIKMQNKIVLPLLLANYVISRINRIFGFWYSSSFTFTKKCNIWRS